MAFTKRLISCFLAVVFLFLSSYPTFAKQPNALIFINHVRGTSCCDAGSLDFFAKQLELFSNQNLPAFFALRYDALVDPEFQKLIKKYQTNDLFKYGIMLEVTPNLAEDSFVEYRGTSENWYQAQYAFLIGYSQEERQLLIDQLVKKYQQFFDQNPEFSTAWQVDTFSLNYLKKSYGLKMHQLAREQWGLDSYTLDGGPPHYPYLASENWAMIPDFSNPDHLLIVRHTVDDPLYSYGDKSSAFTSQPNDYVLDKKDFSYFEKLIDQALDQFQQPGYINLGLENSMAEIHQLEFAKQVEKVAWYQDQNKVTIINNIDQLKQLFKDQPITIHAGKDLLGNSNQKTFWVTTPKYRLRLRFNEDKVEITDLRVYHPKLLDPYWQNTAQNKGYLITPYLINAGLIFPGVGQPSLAQKFLGIPIINTFLAEPIQDVVTATNAIKLPPISDFSTIKQSSLNELSYLSHGRTIRLIFNQNTFEILPLKDTDISLIGIGDDFNPVHYEKTNQGGELSWQVEQKKSLRTYWNCQNQNCLFEFELNPGLFSQMLENQYPFIFPEKKSRPLDQQKTLVYVHNHYALASRNPVRIVVVPQDKHGFPTSTLSETQVKTNPVATKIKVESQNSSREYQFVDIAHDQAEKIVVNLSLDDFELPTQTIYFAPNCKNELIYCLTHPRQSWWFIKTIISDKLRLKLLGENQK